MKPVTFTFEHGTFYLDLAEGYARTTFLDGTYVEARPKPDEGEMWWLHDFLHSLYAQASQQAVSPTLWDVAHQLPPSLAHYEEEGLIIGIQKRGAQAMLDSLGGK
jgi:hypothetical protein